jgi:membrane-associated HD superfamily phosphohydrolase
LQPKLFVIHLLLLVGVLIFGLTIFSQVFTSIATATDSQTKDIEFEDKAIKEELEPIETEEIEDEEEDNTAKQEEEEQQESNDDMAGTGLEEDIMIDDNYSYDDDDVPLELPFDNPMPFP